MGRFSDWYLWSPWGANNLTLEIRKVGLEESRCLCPHDLMAELVLKSGSPSSLLQHGFISLHSQEQSVRTASSPGQSSFVNSVSSTSLAPPNIAMPLHHASAPLDGKPFGGRLPLAFLWIFWTSHTLLLRQSGSFLNIWWWGLTPGTHK